MLALRYIVDSWYMHETLVVGQVIYEISFSIVFLSFSLAISGFMRVNFCEKNDTPLTPKSNSSSKCHTSMLSWSYFSIKKAKKWKEGKQTTPSDFCQFKSKINIHVYTIHCTYRSCQDKCSWCNLCSTLAENLSVKFRLAIT